MRFTRILRVCDGHYNITSAKGWIIFAMENEIDTFPSGELRAMILTDDYQAAVATGLSGQDVYDLILKMRNDNVEGWTRIRHLYDTIEKV